MKFLKIFGQVIMGIIVFGSGLLFIDFNIPGHRDFTDADQIYLLIMFATFILSTIGLLINSIIFYRKKQWVKYRIITMLLSSLIIFLTITIRPMMMNLYYGNVLYEISEAKEELDYINIKLFKNGKFISKTYDAAYNIENVGTYKLRDEILILKFEDEKSDYLGTKYQIIGDSINCIDCEYEIKLIMEKD